MTDYDICHANDIIESDSLQFLEPYFYIFILWRPGHDQWIDPWWLPLLFPCSSTFNVSVFYMVMVSHLSEDCQIITDTACTNVQPSVVSYWWLNSHPYTSVFCPELLLTLFAIHYLDQMMHRYLVHWKLLLYVFVFFFIVAFRPTSAGALLPQNIRTALMA